MKLILTIVLVLVSIFSFGQNNGTSRVLINGSPNFKGAFLFFPLTSDSIKLDNPNLFILLKHNERRKIFYCVYNDAKSKICDLDTDKLEDYLIDIRIPDPLFYQNLYKTKICPLCHKSDRVVPYFYGKPSSRIIKMSDKGEIKLAGCSLSNTSPKFYCKTDKLEF